MSKLFAEVLARDRAEITRHINKLAPTQLNWRTDREGTTSLLVACWQGDAEVAEMLLVAGADPNQTNKRGVAPLMMACHKGHLHCGLVCLHHGADVELAVDRKITPLYAAAAAGHHELVHACIVSGALVDQLTSFGSTPLITAACRGYAACVAVLMHANADLSIRHQGRTALEWALQLQQIEVVRVLAMEDPASFFDENGECSPPPAVQRIQSDRVLASDDGGPDVAL